MKTLYKFNTTKWNKERSTKYKGTFYINEEGQTVKSNFTENGKVLDGYKVGASFGKAGSDFLSQHFIKIERKPRPSRAKQNQPRLFKFNQARWNKKFNSSGKGSYVVELIGEMTNPNNFMGKEVSRTKDFDGGRDEGKELSYVTADFDEIFRAPNGRFAKKPAPLTKYKFFLREIKVVPVIVEAATLEEAEAMVREGDGNYQNENSFHSDLNADEYFDNIFEKDAEIIN